jgi:hypothetical protein
VYLDPDKIQEAMLALRFLPPKMSGTIPPSLFVHGPCVSVFEISGFLAPPNFATGLNGKNWTIRVSLDHLVRRQTR